MNHLRVHKFKLSSAASDNNNTVVGNDNNNSAVGGSGSGKGLLTRIKRYSTLGNKLSRRHLTGSGQKHNVAGGGGSSPPKLSSGSYNMSGANSEDHRLEIGAPVLISTTTLDTDRFGVTEARLKQIGGGIAVNSNIVPTIMTLTTTTAANSAQSSPHIPSSGSENEVFVDALTTQQAEVVDGQSQATNKAELRIVNDIKGDDDDDGEQMEEYMSPCETPAHASLRTAPETDTVAAATADVTNVPLNDVALNASSLPLDASILTELNEVIRAPIRRPRLSKQCQQSKSAQNLHRAELQVYLHKSPSMDLDMNVTAPELNVPELPELFGYSACSLAATEHDDKENSMPQTMSSNEQSKRECSDVVKTTSDGFLAHQHHFKSIDSFSLTTKQQEHQQLYSKRYSTLYTSNTSIEDHQQRQPLGSKHSLASCNSQTSQMSHNSSAIADFNMKSISYQSLNAQNLFVSIDELNEITRQINESEDFNRDIDLDYCTHRDNLKPSERRITLLKNKNSRLINFNQNKEKLKKGWHDVKHWLGEESTRLKEVVQKQTPLKRLGASKLNLNQTDGQGSLSPTRQKSESREPDSSSGACHDASGASGDDNNTHELSTSIDNITDSAADEFDSSVTAKHVSDDDLSPNAKRYKDEGQNGFEELRRYVKQGGDFSKELILVLQERVDSELIYSKSLSKMANKLNKACRELPGSIADAWRGVATEMESRSDIHRQLAASLTDEIVKPLKTIVDSHHKSRKSVESNVDKAARVLSEWRVSEAKAKKASHTAARENEKLQDAMLDIRIQKSPSIALLHQGSNKGAAEKEIKSAEKDCVKLDNKRKKAEEAVKRADVEYYTLCVRAERARVDWEMAVLRGSSQLQSSENQRLINMKNFVSQYVRLTADMNPILNGLVQGLQPQIEACNVAKDMQVVKNIRRNSEGPSEQLLPDFYCEHTTLAMNRERRKHSLIKLLQLVKTDLERERRSRDGLRGLSHSLSNKEHQNITDKLYHIRSMLTYLEGARLKLHSALLELDHKPRTTHPLAQHIQITRDRTGLQQSILKVPNWLKNNDKLNTTNGSVDDANEQDCNNSTMMMTTTMSSNNTSCLNISDAINGKDQQQTIHGKQFKRSKSNIENLSSNPKSMTTNAVAVAAAAVATNKSKTIPANLHEQYSDRGQADGGSNQQDSDFDEFSSQDDSDDEDDDDDAPDTVNVAHARRSRDKAQLLQQQQLEQQPHYQNTQEVHNSAALNLASAGQSIKTSHSSASSSVGGIGSGGSTAAVNVLGRCKALYSYTPKLYDELELNPGDIIEVHAKQDDGWWLGALRNQVGIFPATYVEEFA